MPMALHQTGQRACAALATSEAVHHETLSLVRKPAPFQPSNERLPATDVKLSTTRGHLYAQTHSSQIRILIFATSLRWSFASLTEPIVYPASAVVAIVTLAVLPRVRNPTHFDIADTNRLRTYTRTLLYSASSFATCTRRIISNDSRWIETIDSR